FQAETRQLLDIVTHSLYTDREVFLRELVSNASDALEKLRHARATGTLSGEGAGGPPLEIRVTTDEANNTLTVSDTGIGMTREELVSNLGTIARSGSKAFVQEMQMQAEAGAGAGAGGDSSGVIGRFGVGFYSGFMVADKVDVRSRSAGKAAEDEGTQHEALVWESKSVGARRATKVSSPLSVWGLPFWRRQHPLLNTAKCQRSLAKNRAAALPALEAQRVLATMMVTVEPRQAKRHPREVQHRALQHRTSDIAPNHRRRLAPRAPTVGLSLRIRKQKPDDDLQAEASTPRRRVVKRIRKNSEALVDSPSKPCCLCPSTSRCNPSICPCKQAGRSCTTCSGRETGDCLKWKDRLSRAEVLNGNPAVQRLRARKAQLQQARQQQQSTTSSAAPSAEDREDATDALPEEESTAPSQGAAGQSRTTGRTGRSAAYQASDIRRYGTLSQESTHGAETSANARTGSRRSRNGHGNGSAANHASSRPAPAGRGTSSGGSHVAVDTGSQNNQPPRSSLNTARGGTRTQGPGQSNSTPRGTGQPNVSRTCGIGGTALDVAFEGKKTKRTPQSTAKKFDAMVKDGNLGAAMRFVLEQKSGGGGGGKLYRHDGGFFFLTAPLAITCYHTNKTLLAEAPFGPSGDDNGPGLEPPPRNRIGIVTAFMPCRRRSPAAPGKPIFPYFKADYLPR
ncbi:hypothetical protein THAOC_26491, partial [Thalassiosira oceanica]